MKTRLREPAPQAESGRRSALAQQKMTQVASLERRVVGSSNHRCLWAGGGLAKDERHRSVPLLEICYACPQCTRAARVLRVFCGDREVGGQLREAERSKSSERPVRASLQAAPHDPAQGAHEQPGADFLVDGVEPRQGHGRVRKHPACTFY
jgi:hypothetical protein